MVKQVVEALKAQGVYDNTIIIFTSDNGFAPTAKVDVQLAKGHNPSMMYRGLKTDIYEGGHRVPFIVSWGNKTKQAKVSNQIVSSTDFLRTLSELCNAPLNDQTAEDSFSFLSDITGKKTKYPKRESIIHHSSDGYFAIRKGKWKLIMCSHSGGNGKPKATSAEAKTLPPIQLYDMVADIGETQNVYNKHPEIVKELTDLLTKNIKNGRTTEGGNQTNEGPTYWKQLTWLEDKK